MDNKDKKGKGKFNFVTSEEIEKEEKKVKETKSVEKKDTKKSEKVEEKTVSKKVSNETHFFDLGNKIHYSFETRIIIMSISILALFGISCFFILEALNFGKNKIVSYKVLTIMVSTFFMIIIT